MDPDVYLVEKGDAPPAARFIRTGGVVWSKPHFCLCPVYWVPWHLTRAWIVWLHKPSKACDLGCWWWTLQREISEDPTSYGGGSEVHMKEMLEVGAIHSSQSPWCNTTILVWKKEGGLHFCTDFCKLRAKKDSYPLPHIQKAIESPVGTEYFSCLDLKVGFWQITMDEASKQYTAFTVGNLGLLKYEHTPFGLCNAPATFQRLMQNWFGKLNLMYCLIYLDKVIVFSKTEEEHLQHLHVVFKCFQEQAE